MLGFGEYDKLLTKATALLHLALNLTLNHVVFIGDIPHSCAVASVPYLHRYEYSLVGGWIDPY